LSAKLKSLEEQKKNKGKQDNGMKNAIYGAIEKDGRNRKEDTNGQKEGDEEMERNYKN
jgi:hypothetical protein